MNCDLFQIGDFNLHAGGHSRWKIECDAFTEADIGALALMLSEVLPAFGDVEGVPTGGDRIAAALTKYATAGPLLIVDDVLTSGMSMHAQRRGRDAIGAVLFARGRSAEWITPLFQMRAWHQ